MTKKFIALTVAVLLVCFVAPSALAENGPEPRPDASCTNCKLPITCNNLGPFEGCGEPESNFSGCINYTCSGSCVIRATLTATGLQQGETYSLQTCNADEIGRGVAVGIMGNLTIVGQGDCANLWQYGDGSGTNCGFSGAPTWVLLRCRDERCRYGPGGQTPVFIGNTNDGGVGQPGYNIGTSITCPEECIDQ
jgi:hypothetical protein